MDMRNFALPTTLLMLGSFACADDREVARQKGLPPAPQVANTDGIIQILKRADSLPNGFCIRVHASMWVAGAHKETHFQECWEFTATQVHKVELKANGGKAAYQRRESRPLNIGDACKTLLEGNILAIQENEGDGAPVQFAFTEFECGHRSIVVSIDGKSIFDLGESCLFPGYVTPHAQDFATLYEQLAELARAKFREPNKAK